MSDWTKTRLSILLPTLDAVGVFVDGKLVAIFPVEEIERIALELKNLKAEKA